MNNPILIVEDDYTDYERLRRCIHKINPSLKTQRFESPQEAIKSHQSNERWEIAFIDMNLPEMTGVELIKYLKPKDPKLKCVLMSGLDNCMEQVQNGRSFDYYLSKEFSSELFFRNIKSILLSEFGSRVLQDKIPVAC